MLALRPSRYLGPGGVSGEEPRQPWARLPRSGLTENSRPPKLGAGHSCPHLTDTETEAQRGSMLFIGFTVRVAEWGLPGLPDPKVCAFSLLYLFTYWVTYI